ncbi:MAG TPA: DUF4352 domain-containing protein [Symbiobacteriaceae bacterium]|jgi:hypothetical protein
MIKRSLAVLLAVLLLALAAGCGKNAADPGAKPSGNGNSTDNGQSSSASPSTAPSDTPASSLPTPSSPGWVSSTDKAQQPKTCDPVNLGPLKKGESAKLCSVTITLVEVNTATNGAPQGYAYVLLHFTVKNQGDADFTINTMDHFKLDTPDGKVNTTNATATSQRNPRLQGTLAKGQSTEGWVGFLSKQVKGDYKFTFAHPDFGKAVWTFSLVSQ